MPPTLIRLPGQGDAPRRGIADWVPAISVVRSYQRAWLVKDLLAGMALTAILAPVGMGYAAAAGLPVICGLYATIASLLVYALLGPSRILVLGPDSALAGLIAASILPLAGGDEQRSVALAGMLAILSGSMCVLGGLARLGFVANLLSKPIRLGYLNGIALTVLLGQMPAVLGLPLAGGSFLGEAIALARDMSQLQINWTANAIGVSCLVVIFCLRRWAPAVPGVLVAVAGATIVAATFDLAARAALPIVGTLPSGLPAVRIPAVPLSELTTLMPGAFAIALVSLADIIVLSRTFSQRSGRAVDTDQEIFALGAANVAAGLFQGFSVSASASRTPVAEAAGAKTQLTCVAGAACLALLLVVAPALLHNLPRAALAAVVISACLGLTDVRGTLRLWKLRRSEFMISMICVLGVGLLGVIQGIFAAVCIALLSFVWRSWRPYDAILGRVAGLRGYHDVSRHPEAEVVPGLVLFRWDAPLFFANAEVFREHVLRAVARAATPTKWVVVAAEPVTDVDLTAADMLGELDRELHGTGVELGFAEMKGPVKDQLKHYGLFARLGHENFYPTVGQAVDRYIAMRGVAQHSVDE
jgi:high affinity sulfate transporter 1